MLRTLPVDPNALGLHSIGQPDAVVDWVEKDGRRQPGDQAKDEATGHPLWTCYLVPTLAAPEPIQVRVPAPQQPVLTQFGAVHVDGLVVNVRVDKAGKLAQYWSAAGVRDAGHQGHRRNGEQKAEQAA